MPHANTKGLPGRKRHSVSKPMKQNDPKEDPLTRFTPVIIPPKMSKTIKPEAIFDPLLKMDAKSKGKKKKTT